MFFFSWLFGLLGKIGIKHSKKTPLDKAGRGVSREKDKTDKNDAKMSNELSTGQLDKWRDDVIKNIEEIDKALDGIEKKEKKRAKEGNKIAKELLDALEAEKQAEALEDKNINKATSETHSAEHDLNKATHQLHRLMGLEEHELEALEGDVIEFLAYLLFAGDVAKECAEEEPRIGKELDAITEEFKKFEADFMHSSGHKHEKRRIVKPWEKKGTDSSGFCDLIVTILTQDDTEAFKKKYKEQAVNMLARLDTELKESLKGEGKTSMKKIKKLEKESEDDEEAQKVIDEGTLVKEGVEDSDEAKKNLKEIEDEADDDAEAKGEDEDEGDEPGDDNLGAAAEDMLEQQLEGED